MLVTELAVFFYWAGREPNFECVLNFSYNFYYRRFNFIDVEICSWGMNVFEVSVSVVFKFKWFILAKHFESYFFNFTKPFCCEDVIAKLKIPVFCGDLRLARFIVYYFTIPVFNVNSIGN